MTYNKEYIEQLLRRFMDGETTELEEQFLAEYFSRSDSIPEEWEAYREMFESFSTDAYDFTEEELMGETHPVPPCEGGRKNAGQQSIHNIIKIWPWLAAACIAALMIVFLVPPREENNQVVVVEDVVTQKEVLDSVKTNPISQPQKEQKQIAQAAQKKTSTPQSEHHNPKSKQQESIAESTPAQCEQVKTEEQMMNEAQLMAEQMTQFEDMEMAFRSHSMPIRKRGQQVIHRVTMLQQERGDQQQFVEL